jgi:hypothetical protein
MLRRDLVSIGYAGKEPPGVDAGEAAVVIAAIKIVTCQIRFR